MIKSEILLLILLGISWLTNIACLFIIKSDKEK